MCITSQAREYSHCPVLQDTVHAAPHPPTVFIFDMGRKVPVRYHKLARGGVLMDGCDVTRWIMEGSDVPSPNDSANMTRWMTTHQAGGWQPLDVGFPLLACSNSQMSGLRAQCATSQSPP